jgi:hypothetical protein
MVSNPFLVVVAMRQKEGPLWCKDMLSCIELVGEIGSLKDGHRIIVEIREAIKKRMSKYVIKPGLRHL